MSGRDPVTGKFLKGNTFSAGHGRPKRPREVEIMNEFAKVFSLEEIGRILEMVKTKALQGDQKAIQFMFDRMLGKPLQQYDLYAITQEPDDIINIGEHTVDVLPEGTEE